jgi:site-specific DNA-methyltransferase (adenine-specific)
MMNSATIHKIDAPVLPAKSEVFLTDCMEFMKTCKDNQFDLAVVDPPYGIGEDGAKNHSRGKLAKAKIYTAKNWDRETPNHAYFDELLECQRTK